MVREVVTVNAGQCGIQLGQAIWEQYCHEHKIDRIGQRDDKLEDTTFTCFFEETGSKRDQSRKVPLLRFNFDR